MVIGEGVTPDGQAVVGLRRFERAGQRMVLVVSAQDLRTRILAEDQVRLEPTTWAELGKRSTPYLRALQDAAQYASALQDEDAGITHLLPSEHGVVLTVDLCPYRRLTKGPLSDGRIL